MTGPCITCGGEVGERIPELTKARARLGLPDDPPRRCPKCIWTSLLRLANDPDEDATGSESEAAK